MIVSGFALAKLELRRFKIHPRVTLHQRQKQDDLATQTLFDVAWLDKKTAATASVTAVQGIKNLVFM